MRTIDHAKHAAKRRRIIGAAAVLFAARGYDGTTTAEICRAAGISSGNLFHYFASKRDIFAAIYEDEEDEKNAKLKAFTESAEPLQALHDAVDLLVEPATHSIVPPLVIEAMLRAYRDPDLEASLSRADAGELAALEAIIRNGLAAGEIDAALDSHDAAAWVMRLIGSVYLGAATSPDDFVPAEQLPMLHLILDRFLRPQGS